MLKQMPKKGREKCRHLHTETGFQLPSDITIIIVITKSRVWTKPCSVVAGLGINICPMDQTWPSNQDPLNKWAGLGPRP